MFFGVILPFGDKGILQFVKQVSTTVFPKIVENSVESVDKSRDIVGFSPVKEWKTIFWKRFLWKNGSRL